MVDWRTKGHIQRVLSRVPGGAHANWLLQRHVTHTYPRRGAVLDEVVAEARRHVENLGAALGAPVESVRTFEFGAGWDLAGPLAMSALGLRSQDLVDLRPVGRPSLIRGIADELEARGIPVELGPGPSVRELVAPAGVRYRAPADARETGLPATSVDAAISTNTLEHIDARDIAAILRELRRLLRPGGVCSFAIDYHDHYADADPSIGPHHFLQFDDVAWARWNNSFQHQNRLRHSDYTTLFEQAGFAVEVAQPTVVPAPADLPIADRFLSYDRADLDTIHGWFVLRSPGPGPAT